MKLLKGIGKLTYRVFHPVKTFITSKIEALFEKRINRGKLFTDEQFNEVLLKQKNKEQLHIEDNVVDFDEIKEKREEKININELVHEYLKNSRIDAFDADKLFKGIDKVEELGKTDELVKYINESTDIIQDERSKKLLNKMYDIVNDIKEENIDIYDYLTVYLPDDLSNEQRLSVYQKATKAIENNKLNEAKIREYLDTKKYYMPSSSIDKYNELMSMLKGLINEEDYSLDENIEVLNNETIETKEENSEIINFDDIKKSNDKEKNEKNINNVDEAFNLYKNGQISKEEFKEVMNVAKQDDEILRKSITNTKQIEKQPEEIKIESKKEEKTENILGIDPSIIIIWKNGLNEIKETENKQKELIDKINYYEEFLDKHDLLHPDDQAMKQRMEDKLNKLKNQYNELNKSTSNSAEYRSRMMKYYTQGNMAVDKELKLLEINKQIIELTALKNNTVLNVNSEVIKKYNSIKKELLEIKKECLEGKSKIESYYDEQAKELTKAWVYFK